MVWDTRDGALRAVSRAIALRKFRQTRALDADIIELPQWTLSFLRNSMWLWRLVISNTNLACGEIFLYIYNCTKTGNDAHKYILDTFLREKDARFVRAHGWNFYKNETRVTLNFCFFFCENFRSRVISFLFRKIFIITGLYRYCEKKNRFNSFCQRLSVAISGLHAVFFWYTEEKKNSRKVASNWKICA